MDEITTPIHENSVLEYTAHGFGSFNEALAWALNKADTPPVPGYPTMLIEPLTKFNLSDDGDLEGYSVEYGATVTISTAVLEEDGDDE